MRETAGGGAGGVGRAGGLRAREHHEEIAVTEIINDVVVSIKRRIIGSHAQLPNNKQIKSPRLTCIQYHRHW